MSGLGGLNKSPNGVVIGLVQLQLPVVVTKADLAASDRAHRSTWSARRAAIFGTMDLVVFPEYSLHGLSMDTNPEIMCRLDGPEVAAFKRGLHRQHASGAASRSWSSTRRQPVQFGPDHRRSRRDPAVLSQTPSVDSGRAVGARRPRHSRDATDRTGAKLALIICHDGMFPEMARECAYKGAEIMIRTAGYTAPIRDSWRFTNQANAFQQPDGARPTSACAASDGTLRFHGRRHDRELRRQHHRPWHDRPAPTRSSPPRSAPTSCARRAITGASRTTSISSGTAAIRRGEGRRDGLSLHLHAGHGRRHLPAALGRSGQGDRRHLLRLSDAHRGMFGPRTAKAAE